MARIMQMSITRFGFNPSGWQTIIQQACLKTVEEESEKDKISWFEKLGGGENIGLENQLKSIASKKQRGGYEQLVTNTSPGILARQCRVWLQNTFGNNFRCNHALSSLWSKKEIVDNYLQQKPALLDKLGGD